MDFFESDNPQNVPPPLRGPAPQLTPEEAVRCATSANRGFWHTSWLFGLQWTALSERAPRSCRIQLEAARANDTPRTDHGVHTLYEFAADAGDMERSAYFGFSKDLYHLGASACVLRSPALA